MANDRKGVIVPPTRKEASQRLNRIPQSGSKPSEDSLEILKKRYARGEIEKEEFESKKKDIMA